MSSVGADTTIGATTESPLDDSSVIVATAIYDHLPNFAAAISSCCCRIIDTASLVLNALIVVLKTGPGRAPACVP
ncbi:Uncharacterised protein [Mycobacteroides abscessus subsp. abscessus]|nr:Uncharacterised protein [Mycobacteroides abscessus subsp. abscessus]